MYFGVGLSAGNMRNGRNRVATVPKITMPIVMTGPGTVTPLPVTPVVALVAIPGYLPGVDYRLAEDGSGVQWLAGHGPAAGSAIPVTWQFAADNEAVQVGKIALDNNGEITEIS